MTSTSSRDTFHWLAGVCDASLKIYGRINDGMLQAMSMRASVAPAVGMELIKMFGGSYDGGLWRADPRRQQQFAFAILHFVRDPVLCEKLRTVVRFRLTRGMTKGIHRHNPESVRILRRKLARELEMLVAYEKSLASNVTLRDTNETPATATEKG